MRRAHSPTTNWSTCWIRCRSAPLLAGREGLRLSLAGAQTKLPVVLVDDRVALPGSGQPTTHILKPAIERFPHTTENEALAMTLAAAVGLPVASVTARSVEGRSYLLVTRYDRRVDANGQAHRLHQEDFCQALGIVPERRYAAEGGPTFRISFHWLQRATTRPAGALLAFLDAAVFNLIVGNRRTRRPRAEGLRGAHRVPGGTAGQDGYDVDD